MATAAGLARSLWFFFLFFQIDRAPDPSPVVVFYTIVVISFPFSTCIYCLSLLMYMLPSSPPDIFLKFFVQGKKLGQNALTRQMVSFDTIRDHLPYIFLLFFRVWLFFFLSIEKIEFFYFNSNLAPIFGGFKNLIWNILKFERLKRAIKRSIDILNPPPPQNPFRVK
jgi:hypothetical protein